MPTLAKRPDFRLIIIHSFPLNLGSYFWCCSYWVYLWSIKFLEATVAVVVAVVVVVIVIDIVIVVVVNVVVGVDIVVLPLFGVTDHIIFSYGQI